MRETLEFAKKSGVVMVELDNDFLRKGDVFTSDVIETWLEYRRNEITEVQLRRHPHEFELYYDA